MMPPRTGLASRLVVFLDAESEALARDPHFDIEASNRRKQRLLHELAGEYARDFTPEEAQALRTSLERNRSMIALQLEVARRMSELVRAARRDVRSDGCYDEWSL